MLAIGALWATVALSAAAQPPRQTAKPEEPPLVLPLRFEQPAPFPWETSDKPATSLKPPLPIPSENVLPINLATALRLAGAQPVTVALAEERVIAANAQLLRARAQWLPSLYLGANYARHDGQIQEVLGKISTVSRSSLLGGGGPTLLLSFSDAIFEPLAARQRLNAQVAAVQAARNDSMLETTDAYFSVQQARGDLAAAEDVVRRGEDLLKRTEKLAEGLISPLEAARVRAELSRRRQTLYVAKERWTVASADLSRVLRLEPGALVEPLEPPHLQVTLVPLRRTAAELLPVALRNRPEVPQLQALLLAAEDRVRQERARPFVPSLVVRGNAGVFGGGTNREFANFDGRSDWDVLMLWEWQNLGVGNKARLDERRSESTQTYWEFVRVKDRIAAEVTQALAQAKYAHDRLLEADKGVKDAVDSADKNFEGLTQTRRVGDVLFLVIRPQEAVQALQALSQAYGDFFTAVADYDRAQFRLYRALGAPAPESLAEPK